jgi:predicted nucleic acid-binding protein
VGDRVFLDTNVLVYAYDIDEPAKRDVALRTIGAGDPVSLVLSAQVLGEFFWVATRRLRRPLSVEAASAAVDALSELPCVAIDADLVMRAIGRSRADRLAYWDALIVESALADGCTVLLTEDLAAGTRFDGLTVVDPFAGQ